MAFWLFQPVCANFVVLLSGHRLGYQILPVSHVVRVQKPTAMREPHANRVRFSHGSGFFGLAQRANCVTHFFFWPAIKPAAADLPSR